MEKKYVRKPFDIELAKKIQSKEIEGRIVTANGNAVLLVTNIGSVAVSVLNLSGDKISSMKDLFIELPEQPKHEFKPFEQVLVRDGKGNQWKADYYSHTIPDKNGDYYSCVGNVWKYCIPYAGNEHLLGTTNEPKEE